MALTYFIDSDLDPVVDADAYANLADMNNLLGYHNVWQAMTDEQKESEIKRVTAYFDTLDLAGVRVGADATEQTLEFPRDFGSTASPWAVIDQKKKLLRAVASQIEFNLNRPGIGVLEFSRGDLSAIPSQETLCRPALMALSVYMK